MRRIHVAIVGVNRSLSHTADSIIREIVRPLTSSRFFDTHVSLTLIRPPGGVIDNPRSGESGHIEQDIPEPLRSWPVTVINQEGDSGDAATERVPTGNLSDSWGDKVSSFRNLRHFLNALHVTYFSHVLPNSPDYVIMVRPDVRIDGRLWLRTRLFTMILRGGRRPQALLPSWARHRGANDRFAILSASAAAPYFTRVSHIDDFFSEGSDLNSEKFLAWVLRKTATSHSIYTPMRRIRLGGVSSPEDDALVARSALTRRADIFRARSRRKIRTIFRSARRFPQRSR